MKIYIRLSILLLMLSTNIYSQSRENKAKNLVIGDLKVWIESYAVSGWDYNSSKEEWEERRGI